MTGALPRVSVILPAYNAEPFVALAVSSILRQSLTDLELVAIDDGSTDATGRILAEIASRDPRVRLTRRENRGLTRSLEEALETSRSGYVAVMNADDVALPERLAKQAAFLDDHPAVAAVGSQTRLMLADGTPGPATSLPQQPGEVRSFLAKASALAHPAVMLRREAALAVGGYRPQIEPAEDYDLWLRLAEQHDLANLPDVLLHYRVHGGQATARAAEAVAVASLVAQAAAQTRRAGRPDPVEGKTNVDRALAGQLGITSEAIARHAIENALSRSESLLTLGEPEATVRQPLKSLRADRLSADAPKFFAAAAVWLDGRVLMSAGHYGLAVPLLLKAAVGEPIFRSRLAGALARWANQRLTSAKA